MNQKNEKPTTNKVHIFVDGTWLFNVCKVGYALSGTTYDSTKPFRIDWKKLNETLLKYVEQHSSQNLELGDKYIVTSIFDLPTDFEQWIGGDYDDITEEELKRTSGLVRAKNKFTASAYQQGYTKDAVLTPRIKPWIVKQLTSKTYQEKQVDTTVVALLVKSAITNQNDFHIVVSGDADMLPAIKVAYPEYTKNVVLVTTHPDELSNNRQHSSFSYLDFKFTIPAFYLQDNSDRIMEGAFVYKCVECAKVFSTKKAISNRQRPRCPIHKAS